MGFCLFCLTLLSWIYQSACLANIRWSRKFIEWVNEWTQARQMLPVCEPFIDPPVLVKDRFFLLLLDPPPLRLHCFLTCSTTVWRVKFVSPSKPWVNGVQQPLFPFFAYFILDTEDLCSQCLLNNATNRCTHSFNTFKKIQ